MKRPLAGKNSQRMGENRHPQVFARGCPVFLIYAFLRYSAMLAAATIPLGIPIIPPPWPAL